MAVRKILSITVKERVSRSVELTIGEDITQAEADQLLQLVETDDEFKYDSEEYGLISDRLYDDWTDTDGFEDVEIETYNN